MNFFLSYDPSICFVVASPPLVNFIHDDVSVSIYFPSNSIGDADWDLILVLIGIIFVIIDKIFHGRIFLKQMFLLVARNILPWSRLELTYLALHIR